MADTRAAHLLELLWMERPTAVLATELSVYPWDRAHDLVMLTAEHVAHALERFADGHIGPSDVAEWAKAVWDREDIDQDATTPGPGRVVSDLAHPERMPALRPQEAKRLAAQLRRDAT